MSTGGPQGDPRLNSIVAEAVPKEPAKAAESFSEESAFLDNELKRINVESARQDMAERKNYANKLFWLIVGWLVGVFLFLLMAGFKKVQLVPFVDGYFVLSDNVLLALIGGTTTTVIGLFLVVVWNLFPNQNNKK
ncbi:MAG: hypothetical protein J0M17_12455 [Planctomycetes bacterium]|nr:hypothetical protein [Planctomycetota bacterium]